MGKDEPAVITKEYKDKTMDAAKKAMQKDAAKMAKKGYAPSTVNERLDWKRGLIPARDVTAVVQVIYTKTER